MNTPKTIEMLVARKETECEGIVSFALAPVDDRVPPAYSAGAHIDVHTPAGLVRQYSLCDASDPNLYVIGVLRDPASRGGSASMHERLNVGDHVLVSAPKNHFPLVADADHSLLLAGGIGVTPLRLMAEELAHRQESFDLHYSGRSEGRMAFVSEFRQKPYANRIHLHFDDEPESQKVDLRSVLNSPSDRKHLYVCGPEGYLDFVRTAARERGWKDSFVHFEYFGGKVPVSEGSHAFEVELKSNGRVITVRPDQSCAEALTSAGIELPLSCEQGVCGTCLTRVLAGKVDHRDLYLSSEEQAQGDQFLPCCSRALSTRLVLDL